MRIFDFFFLIWCGAPTARNVISWNASRMLTWAQPYMAKPFWQIAEPRANEWPANQKIDPLVPFPTAFTNKHNAPHMHTQSCLMPVRTADEKAMQNKKLPHRPVQTLNGYNKIKWTCRNQIRNIRVQALYEQQIATGEMDGSKKINIGGDLFWILFGMRIHEMHAHCTITLLYIITSINCTWATVAENTPQKP